MKGGVLEGVGVGLFIRFRICDFPKSDFRASALNNSLFKKINTQPHFVYIPQLIRK